MDKRLFFLLAGLLATGPLFAVAYRWVDSEGVVHYSDRPEPGAEEISLPDANTTTVRRYTHTVQPQEKPKPPASRYESIEIAAPAAEETLWNIEGVLKVSVALTPALQPGHQVRVYLDGKAKNVSGMSFTLQDVYRGVHNLQAEVLDETGKTLIKSKPSRFYVQQNSVKR
ncbi:MAG TPA: DUF4124 domain-containing protein [Woeseiaceae bacterium]|nr:DUF4124 domain-containing protein [Woeseiaceae bacterium]